MAAILASLVAGYQLKIVKDDGSIIDIKDVTEDTIQTVKTRVDEIKTRLSKTKEEEEGETLSEEAGIEVEIRESDSEPQDH